MRRTHCLLIYWSIFAFCGISCDTVVVHATLKYYDDNEACISLINNSNDTVYVFSSYFDKELCRSIYLHRYAKKDKMYKLSFLPLLPYLSPNLSDNVVDGASKIISKSQIKFVFISIAPKDTVDIYIPKEALVSNRYMRDVCAERKNKFDSIRWKKWKEERTDNLIHVEFAIYKDVSFAKLENYYFDEYKAAERALDYSIVICKIVLNETN